MKKQPEDKEREIRQHSTGAVLSELINDANIQELLDTFPFYVMLIDPGHHILMANKALSKDLGADPTAVIGLYCPRAIHGLDQPFPGCPLEEAVKTGQAAEQEQFDPRYKQWFRASVYPTRYRTPEGKPVFLHLAHNITEKKLAEEALEQSLNKLQKALEDTVDALALTVELRDPYTAGHQRGVSSLAVAIAQEMGLPEEQIESIHIAGHIHDIGKISIPAEILSKPGRLNEIEFNMIKLHAQAGHNILKNIQFPWHIDQIVLQHHERWDGSGYPVGLVGEGILLEARILAVADVVEAMSSHRPYRPTLGLGTALEEISKNAGKLYDPRVAEACVKLFYEKDFKLEE